MALRRRTAAASPLVAAPANPLRLLTRRQILTVEVVPKRKRWETTAVYIDTAGTKHERVFTAPHPGPAPEVPETLTEEE